MKVPEPPSNYGQPPPSDPELRDLLDAMGVPRLPRYEYAHCVDYTIQLTEMGAEGWRVVPGSGERVANVNDESQIVWLMERRVQ